MTGDGGRRPWWYSGDPEDADVDPEDAAGIGAHSRADAGGHASEGGGDHEGGQDAAPGVDWTMLVAGAQRMVDWATERVMAPHAEHGDPADHPQCVVCRTLVVVGDPSALRTSMPEDAGERDEGEPPAITWIPIRDDEDLPPLGH